MSFKPQCRSTLLIPSGDTDHLFVLLTDPVEVRTGKGREVLLVNLSLRPKRDPKSGASTIRRSNPEQKKAPRNFRGARQPGAREWPRPAPSHRFRRRARPMPPAKPSQVGSTRDVTLHGACQFPQRRGRRRGAVQRPQNGRRSGAGRLLRGAPEPDGARGRRGGRSLWRRAQQLVAAGATIIDRAAPGEICFCRSHTHCQ